VGTKLEPGSATTKSDGTVVRTLWARWRGSWAVRKATRSSQTPTRRPRIPGPHSTGCSSSTRRAWILIDEWVAYARQLYANSGLPAGTFDTHFTFAQALTEAVKATPGVLLAVSIPASDSPEDTGDKDLRVQLRSAARADSLR